LEPTSFIGCCTYTMRHSIPTQNLIPDFSCRRDPYTHQTMKTCHQRCHSAKHLESFSHFTTIHSHTCGSKYTHMPRVHLYTTTVHTRNNASYYSYSARKLIYISSSCRVWNCYNGMHPVQCCH